MTKAADLSALGSNVTTAGNLSSASTLTLQTNSTTALTIDTSQNVGIGTSSVLALTKLDVRGAISAYDGGTQETRLNTEGNIELARTDGVPFIDFKSSTAEDYDCRIQQISNGLTFQTGGNGTASERMRIDSSGNVLVGATSGNVKLYVRANLSAGTSNSLRFLDDGAAATSTSNNSYGYGFNATTGELSSTAGSGGFHSWYTSNAERMRITSAGNVGIGTASPSYPLQVSGTMLQSGQWAVIGAHNGGGNYPVPTDIGVAFAWNFTGGGRDACIMNNDTLGNGVRFVQRTGTSSSSFIGQGFNTGAWNQGNNSSTWTVTSDARIKTNVREINGALDKINALHPCHFEYIDKVGKIKTGFIAQEFETVLAGHVNTQDFVPEEYKNVIPEGEGIKGIDADLIPYLVKAIQEQQTIINDLKADIVELKEKVGK